MKILEILRTYHPSREKEMQGKEQTIAWIEKYGAEAFVRENLAGHITASILVVDPTFEQVLLMHHKKLDRWLQFGGHSDGDTDSEQVAIKEFHEESGIQELPNNIQLFGVDAHTIPERGSEPEHTHFDLLFIGTISRDSSFQAREAEVNDIRWFSIDQARTMVTHDYLKEILDKLENIKREFSLNSSENSRK